MDLKLSGRTVLVTGASKGIGLGIARWFAREGCALRLAARSKELLEREAAAIRASAKVDVQAFAVDLATEEGRKKLTEACPEVDVLVNNAGAVPPGSLDDIDDAAWRAGWELKVYGYVALTRHYLARMKVRRKGVIVNIIGAAGERPNSAFVSGSMGNAGLMAMTLALGAASPEHGVRVVGVNPGPVATDRVVELARKRAQTALGDPERYPELLKKNPFGRPATVDEIAASVVFLASDLCSYTSGTIVTIDGGSSKRAAA
jgi:NAD(P)-dependent dehydrogenase (short-subunit alcohol dehydrogenase family)